MKQSPSWLANSSSASQEILRILWNPHVPYRIYKSPWPYPVSDRSSLCPTTHFSKIHFNITSQLCLGLPSGYIYWSLKWRYLLRFPVRNNNILLIYNTLYKLYILYIRYYIIIFFFYPAFTTLYEFEPPHSRGSEITPKDAPQSVGLFWTSNQPVAENYYIIILQYIIQHIIIKHNVICCCCWRTKKNHLRNITVSVTWTKIAYYWINSY
jgi:hypothetical protein